MFPAFLLMTGGLPRFYIICADQVHNSASYRVAEEMSLCEAATLERPKELLVVETAQATKARSSLYEVSRRARAWELLKRTAGMSPLVSSF